MDCEKWKRPKKVLETFCERSGTEPSTAVHAFFDRVENNLPRYVSRVPSLLAGFVTTVVILCIGGGYIHREKKGATELSPALRTRLAGMTAGLVLAALFIGNEVRDSLYGWHMLSTNAQHFANVYWLKQYAGATGGSILSLS